MKPLTLLLNVYNSNKEYLGKTIDSIKNQSLPKKDFEVVIYDDGSKDDTFDFVSGLVSGMSNVRVYTSSENLGLASSRNGGISKSTGKYISQLDDDDLLQENALESALKFFKDNPEVHYAYSKHKRINSEGDFICDREGFEYDSDRILHYNFVGHLKSFSREIHDKIGGFSPEILYAQDWDHVLKADFVLDESQIKRNPEFLYLYRVHDNSISTTKNEVRKEYICKFLEHHLGIRGINANVFWSHKRPDLYNYFDWREKK